MNQTIQDTYQRYSRKRFKLPTEAQVRGLEQRIKVDFPDDYRRFVLEFNGGYFVEPTIKPAVNGCPEEGLTYLCGISASHPVAELGEDLDLFDDNDPPQLTPIGATSRGSLIILDTAPGDGRGQLYFKEAFGDFYRLAENIEAFFTLLRDPPVV